MNADLLALFLAQSWKWSPSLVLALVVIGWCFVWRADGLESIAEAIEHQTVHISGTDCQAPRNPEASAYPP